MVGDSEITATHLQNIALILDVVYNHVNERSHACMAAKPSIVIPSAVERPALSAAEGDLRF
jgi:hypothetical protein